MKKSTDIKFNQRLWRGLAGICLTISLFVAPVSMQAEEPPKYVMPQEQVYLDPSQVEAAKKQKEIDAFYNDKLQKGGTVSNEKTVKEGAAKPSEPEMVNTAPVLEQKPETPPPKYVMPQEQVYLDPSQVEAAKNQVAEDARISGPSQAKNVEIVSGNRVIADVKVVEKTETEHAIKTETNAVTKKAEENKNITAQPETEKPAATATKEIKEIKPETPQSQEAVKGKPETPKAAEGNVKPEGKTTETVAENKNETLAASPETLSDPRQRPVRLHRFGVAKEFTTHNTTVGAVLREMTINLDGRTVYPPPDTEITDGMIIHVLARKSFLSQEEVEVPFGTQIINDPELEFGTRKVEKEGVKGKDLVTYENITRPGREQKIELDRRRVAEPVNEVVRQGVAQSILTPNGYVRYKKKIYGEATAYTWGGGASGHTSIGLWPKRGIVAVDPRVIPYYTKLYIPGYGMAIAGDTGGAIVGTRIDLFMDSLYECFQWGRRDVEIYILE